MSPCRRSRRRVRRQLRRQRAFRIQYAEPLTLTPPNGFIPMPDGWTMEAGKTYEFLSARLQGEPEQRWYREIAPEEKS
jgi:hypothetical protein